MKFEIYFNNQKEVISEIPATFEEFRDYISTVFSISSSSRWKVKYTDSEDDEITMCDAKEYESMSEEFKVLEENNYAGPVKLYVVSDQIVRSGVVREDKEKVHNTEAIQKLETHEEKKESKVEVEEKKDEKAEFYSDQRKEVEELIKQGKFLKTNKINFLGASDIMKQQSVLDESEMVAPTNDHKEEQKPVVGEIILEVPVEPVELKVVLDEKVQSTVVREDEEEEEEEKVLNTEVSQEIEVEEKKNEKDEQFYSNQRKIEELIKQDKFFEANKVIKQQVMLCTGLNPDESEVVVPKIDNREEEQKLVVEETVPEVPVESPICDVVIVSGIQESEVYAPGIIKKALGFIGLGK